MKIIHTADWHLGSKMHSSDRMEEQENFLKWMKEEIELEEAETLVIAGDIFDVSNPSNESRKQFFSFLASLQNTCCKNIVVVAGNHDSGFMLNSIKDLGELLNIHIVGLLEQTEMKDIVFELKDKDGKVTPMPSPKTGAYDPYMYIGIVLSISVLISYFIVFGKKKRTGR